ncbi:general secretion pathway protein GspM [Geomonas sp. RF6]|uniref:general secretion pathway protein GspM n=1 Tax=Geomonas sp. RF6 TaxID=2897342 RepID=UPI001E4FC176|nr:general secretion pathway protein GspM [Geomonas sp. RF6]UFS71602.1 general secretion pathway protein GspM [Geomonas sp. RF6]
MKQITDLLQRMDRTTRLTLGIALAVALVAAIGLSALNGRIKTLEKKRVSREADLKEMMTLKVRYLEASAVSQRLSNRLAATKADDSPAKIVEEIGIKGKGSQVKPVKGEEIPGYVEDAAEVKIEGLTSNEAVNLLYRLEKGTRPVAVKKALIKQRFDDQSKVDVGLTVALIKPAPQGSR